MLAENQEMFQHFRLDNCKLEALNSNEHISEDFKYEKEEQILRRHISGRHPQSLDNHDPAQFPPRCSRM